MLRAKLERAKQILSEIEEEDNAQISEDTREYLEHVKAEIGWLIQHLPRPTQTTLPFTRR